MNPATSEARNIAIRDLRTDSPDSVTITLTDELVAEYSLEAWSQEFSLMTAGYRARLDVDDLHSSQVPFNSLTVAIFVEAKARVFSRLPGPDGSLHVHVGGEVRPHTQDFIRIASRIYAQHGFTVHLRSGPSTTPIWYSSFGVFYNEYGSGDNFTASHSQYYKGGWKPVDADGKQLTAEEDDIIAEVRRIVAGRESITLAPWGENALIVEDFDVDEAYTAHLQNVLGNQSLADLRSGLDRGFRCAICTLGGSMKRTTTRIFDLLEIKYGPDEGLWYYMDEESPNYHGVGELPDGNHGVDPSSPTTYKGIAAEEILAENRANIVLIWDPDGDRVNFVSTIPTSEKETALTYGLDVGDDLGDGRHLVYFTPNQTYLMLAAYRLQHLKSNGQLDAYDWFIAESFPTATSLEELAIDQKIPCVRVGVGFKHFGDLCAFIESQPRDQPTVFTSAIGDRTTLGKEPRALLLAEESGGSVMGGPELMTSRTGARKLLSLREKDAMVTGLMILGLASRLHESTQSFCAYYQHVLESHHLRTIYYDRLDFRLYDEGLIGPALQEAKTAGFQKRDELMGFFHELATAHHADQISLPDAHAAISARASDSRASDSTWDLPNLNRFCVAGDGILIQCESLRILIRASGTDALLRFYVESSSEEILSEARDLMSNTVN